MKNLTLTHSSTVYLCGHYAHTHFSPQPSQCWAHQRPLASISGYDRRVKSPRRPRGERRCAIRSWGSQLDCSGLSEVRDLWGGGYFRWCSHYVVKTITHWLKSQLIFTYKEVQSRKANAGTLWNKDCSAGRLFLKKHQFFSSCQTELVPFVRAFVQVKESY